MLRSFFIKILRMAKSLIFTLSLFHTNKSEGKHDFCIIEIIVPYIDCIYINTMFVIATLFKIGIKSNKYEAFH